MPSTTRLTGKRPPEEAEKEFQRRYLTPLLEWLPKQDQKTATAAAIMRKLRTYKGFSRFAQLNPQYSRAATIVMNHPDRLQTVSGGSTRNPRIRWKAGSRRVPAEERPAYREAAHERLHALFSG